ncbi:IDEAL domain-containing protein [Bacillus suaedaesalsae]|uniref:IDEAL domain-containing protein n=1 Tax=Bacillus suaedaesalsae TaxID=2810349 RepID=A0ABS2DFC6_9BACI|nr:IDEAL domain-containing protein [Bacillus suaedaesalsae]MBM6617163.1 IDEAL domain-containing protein [Bacillus suaedaesalsae]
MKVQKEAETVNVYVQMILDEIIFTARAKKLGIEIDDALDKRDDQLFYRLTNEYNQLMKHA